VVARGRGALEACAEAVRDACGRNAVARYTDHAADRLRTVTQGGGPSSDLDLVGGERIDRHAVILAEIGKSMRADTVLLEMHAEIVETADHRPARAGSVSGGGDARLAEHNVAERGRAIAQDLRAGNDCDRREDAIDDGQDPGLQAGNVAGRASRQNGARCGDDA